jgi:hypothetical protein
MEGKHGRSHGRREHQRVQPVMKHPEVGVSKLSREADGEVDRVQGGPEVQGPSKAPR